MPQMNERNDGVGLAIGRARQTNAGRKFPPLKFGRWLLGCGRSGAPARFVARSGRNGVRGQGGCGACLLAIRLSQRRSLDRLLHRSTTVNVRCVSYRLKDRRKAGCGPTMCHIPFWPNWKKNRGSQVSERHVSTSSGVWTTNTLSFRDPSVLHGKLGSDPQSGQGRNEIGCQTADGWFRQCYA